MGQGMGRAGLCSSLYLQKGQPQETEGIHLVSEETNIRTFRGTYTWQQNGTTGISLNLTMIYSNSCTGEGKNLFNDREWKAVLLTGTRACWYMPKLGINQQSILTAKVVSFSWASRSTVSRWRKMILPFSLLLVWLHLLGPWDKKKRISILERVQQGPTKPSGGWSTYPGGEADLTAAPQCLQGSYKADQTRLFILWEDYI